MVGWLKYRRDVRLTRLKLRRAGVPHSPAIRRVLGLAVANVANVANVTRHTPFLSEPMHVWVEMISGSRILVTTLPSTGAGWRSRPSPASHRGWGGRLSPDL